MESETKSHSSFPFNVGRYASNVRHFWSTVSPNPPRIRELKRKLLSRASRSRYLWKLINNAEPAENFRNSRTLPPEWLGNRFSQEIDPRNVTVHEYTQRRRPPSMLFWKAVLIGRLRGHHSHCRVSEGAGGWRERDTCMATQQFRVKCYVSESVMPMWAEANLWALSPRVNTRTHVSRARKRLHVRARYQRMRICRSRRGEASDEHGVLRRGLLFETKFRVV